MPATPWLAQHWFELLQTVGIVGSLSLAAYTTWKDEHARRIGNSIAISSQHRELWKSIYDRSDVKRVLSKSPDLATEGVSLAEELFVTTLISHLSTVYRAMKYGEFVKLDGLKEDVRGFFALPIPRAVWNKLKPFQDNKFVAFIENSLGGDGSVLQ